MLGYIRLLAEISTRGTRCLKMLFGVNLELHLSALLICLIFQVFAK